jgi:peptide deformylase
VLKIRTYPDPVLSRRTRPVREIDRELRGLMREMFDTMYEGRGVGLAAPQVGEGLRMCVVNVTGKSDGEFVLVNPVLLEATGEAEDEEGCLSVPGIRSKVTRPEHIKVQAYDENGRELELEADGLEARCIQHEMDHLDGRLFFQRLNEAARMTIRRGLRRLEEEAEG